MFDLKAQLQNFFARFIPIRRSETVTQIGLEDHIAHTMTADKLHSILREAESGNTRSLFALYRDIIAGDSDVQSDFSTRKLAVLGDIWSIQPFDKKVPEDVKAAEAIESMLNDCPSFMDRMKEMLDGTLYPLVLMEKQFKPSTRTGLRFELCGLHHQEPQLFDWTTGSMRIEDVDAQTGMPCGRYTAPDRNRFITHRGHLMTTPDQWGGPMRAILFWWLFSAMDRDWWVRFLDRFGAPFLVGKYDQADDASRISLQSAFSAATRLFGLVVSRDTEVEVQQASASQSADAFEKFQDYAAKRKCKLILGQTLSTYSDPTGIGGGASGEHGQVRGDIRRYDGICLAATLRDQLFTQYLRINGIPGRAPRLVFGADDPEDMKSVAEFLKGLSASGLQLTAEALEVLGQRAGYGIERATQAAASTVPGLPVNPSAEVSDSAMNGAQVQSLVQVIQAVAGKTLPPKAALEVLTNAFPNIPQDSLNRMLTEAVAAKAEPSPPGGAPPLKTFSADPANPTGIDAVARSGAADLALAFRGELAPVRQLISESTSPADLERRIKLFYADWRPGKTAQLVADALTAYAANGLDRA